MPDEKHALLGKRESGTEEANTINLEQGKSVGFPQYL